MTYQNNKMLVLREIADQGKVSDFDIDLEFTEEEVIAYVNVLGEEGLITGNFSPDGFEDVMPTAKGLRELDAQPQFVRPSTPWGMLR